MTEFLEKIKHLAIEIDNQQVDQQAKEIMSIIQTIEKKQVLAKAPDILGFYPDKLEEIMTEVGPQKAAALKIINQLFNSTRQFLSIHYGLWSLPNLETAQAIKENLHVNSALEIMAGNAYWTRALQQVGVETVATDSLQWAKTSRTGQQPFASVVNLNASSAIAQYSAVDLILCSWAPNFNRSDLAAVNAWQKYNPKSHFLFIGEKNGATNSPAFWHQEKFRHSPALRQIKQTFTSYDFIDEQIFEIEHEI